MNAPPQSTLPPIDASVGGTLRRVLKRFTWRTVAVILAISLIFQSWVLVELSDLYPTMSFREAFLSAGIINVLMAFSIACATLVADEKVARGAARLPAYAMAVVIGSAIGAIAQWYAHRWLHVVAVNLDVPTANPIYDVSGNIFQPVVAITQPAVMFFEFLLWGAIVVSIYAVRRTALEASERLSKAQIGRAHAQRRTLESRLQALQARVEPQFLFNTLAQVRDLYGSNPVAGGRMLDDLIAYLRAALPHLRESDSTVAQEVDLVKAFLRIIQADLGDRLSFDVDTPQEVLAARVPAMMLLPVVDRVLIDNVLAPDAAGAIHVAVRASGGSTRMEISCAGSNRVAEDTRIVLSDIRDRLRGLYGAAGKLEVETAPQGSARIVMEIPHASANGSHR